MPFGLATDLPLGAERPLRAQLLEERLVAFRDLEGRLGLIYGLCPHARGDMFFSTIDGEGIRCNYHGWKFDVNGICVETPMHPDGCGVDTLAYPVREHAGLLWGYLGTADAPPLPDVSIAASAVVARRPRPWLEAVLAELLNGANEPTSVRAGTDQLEVTRNNRVPATFSLPSSVSVSERPGITLLVPADQKNTVVIGVGDASPTAAAETVDAARAALVELLETTIRATSIA
ncbi:MAG: Rieske 2Fe-2S domain-containing protein [Chloroflexota bacterium]